VADKGLDFGVAFDGDADRIGASTARAGSSGATRARRCCAEPVLKAHPGGTDHRRREGEPGLFDRIAELGGKPVMWKTGHSLIKSKMKETARRSRAR
jgi:phosphomannomutase